MLPLLIEGNVVRGFGRGRQIGVPTANLDAKSVTEQLPDGFPMGIYFGWAQIAEDGNGRRTNEAVPMVSSVGLNPFYKNQNLTVEVHLLPSIHQRIPKSFYDCRLRVLFTGFLRGEKDFTSTLSLIDAIRQDILDAKQQLSHEQQVRLKNTYFSERRRKLSDLPST